jgi:Tfp pilus assembly PilM family ATPase
MNFISSLKTQIQKISFSKPVIGISITDASIAVVKLNNNGEVVTSGKIELGKDEISNQKIMLERLQAVLKNTRPQSLDSTKKKQKVIVNLPEAKVYIESLKFAEKLSGDDLRQKVAETAAKIMPLDFDEIYWDYAEIPAMKNSKEIQVVFIAVEKPIADAIAGLLNLANLELVAFELESVALGRVLFDPTVAKNTAILDLGAKISNLSIFDATGALCSANTIPVTLIEEKSEEEKPEQEKEEEGEDAEEEGEIDGGDQGAKKEKKGKKNLKQKGKAKEKKKAESEKGSNTKQQQPEIKVEEAIKPDSEKQQPEAKAEPEIKLSAATTTTPTPNNLKKISVEVGEIIKHFEESHGQNIETIIVTGEIANLSQAVTQLKEELKKEVKIAEAKKGIKLPNSSPTFIKAFGVALRNSSRDVFSKINLLPETKPKQKTQPVSVVVAKPQEAGEEEIQKNERHHRKIIEVEEVALLLLALIILGLYWAVNILSGS